MRFSEAFNMEFQQSNLDFIDIPLDTDLKFFIDPTFIRALKTNWGGDLERLIQDYFSDVMAAIKNGDLKRAGILLSSLKESNSFHLGYSSKKSSGKALGVKTAELILESLKKSKAAQTGLLNDLEDTALTIDGIASDRISDSVCNILKLPFINYTQSICEFYNVKMSDVSGIRLWDPISGRWGKKTFKLPVYNGEEIILIPKVLAREKISYSHSKFYRKYIIPEIRSELVKAGSALVTLLRGEQTVTTKKIIEEYGQSKAFIEEQIVKYPDAIKQYKEELLLSPPPPLPHRSFDDSKAAVSGPLSSDVNNLKLSIRENNKELYIESLKKIFLTIFYPSLFYPCFISKDVKGYSFTMLNESRAGFFFDFSVFEIPAEKVLINILMSSSFITESYLENLAQEMDVINTSVCLLSCCEATNELQKDKIKALAKSKGKYIFIINSAVVDGILDEYYKIGEQYFSVLRDKFKELN